MKAITSPALIKGVFRELAALRRMVYLNCETTSGSSRVSIIDDFSRSDLSQNVVQFQDLAVCDATVVVSFELDGIYYTCKLEAALTGASNFLLPSSIEPGQRRKGIRSDLQSLSRQPITVEARGQLWRGYGYLKDSDNGFLTARVSFFGNQPSINDFVRLRAYTQQAQILSTSAQIKEIRSIQKSEQVELLLDPYGYREPPKKIRSGRTAINVLTFLELHWPDVDGLRIRVEVLDVNSTGFSARWVGNQKEFPPKGAICKIGGGEILAQLQWQTKDRIGFDLSINDRQVLALWSTWIDEWHLKVLNRTPVTRQQERIASVLIRSGYLRDFKASAFTSTPSLLSLIPNSTATRTWLKRFLRGGENDIDAHISFARCTDSSWIIQELGNSAIETRVGDAIIRESMQAFHAQETPYINYGSTLLALFDPLSKFNQAFWMKRESFPSVNTYEARLINIESGLDHFCRHNESDSKVIEVSLPSVAIWPNIWNELQKWVPLRTLFGLGLRGDDYASPELRQSLAKSGYYLERHVTLIHEGSQLIGFAVALGVPTFSNLNATSSHLWIILKDMKHWGSALQKLMEGESQIRLLGATEAVVFATNFESTALTQNGYHPSFARRRKIQFIPTYNLLEYLKQEESLD